VQKGASFHVKMCGKYENGTGSVSSCVHMQCKAMLLLHFRQEKYPKLMLLVLTFCFNFSVSWLKPVYSVKGYCKERTKKCRISFRAASELKRKQNIERDTSYGKLLAIRVNFSWKNMLSQDDLWPKQRKKEQISG